MFIDYTALILKDYNRKKEAGRLSINLSQPSPAKIREECLVKLQEELRPSDEQILRTFFGSPMDKNALARNIKNFDIDKLKPLVNYLKNPKIKTDEKNIELLAWLLGFQNRPFKHGRNYDTHLENVDVVECPPRVNEETGTSESENLETNNKEEELNTPVAQIEKKVSFWGNTLTWIGRRKKQLAIGLSLVGILIFLPLIRYKNLGQLPNMLGLFSGSPNGKFMYWDGMQYQEVTPDKKLGNTPIFELDTFKYNHLKRITTPDTITYNAKGYVWYIKINGDIEYYTSGGVHPVHTERHLKPISNYMIKKYIHPW